MFILLRQIISESTLYTKLPSNLFVINYSYIINNHVFTSIILTKGLKPKIILLHSHQKLYQNLRGMLILFDVFDVLPQREYFLLFLFFIITFYRYKITSNSYSMAKVIILVTYPYDLAPQACFCYSFMCFLELCFRFFVIHCPPFNILSAI